MPSRSTSRPSWLGSCRLLAKPICLVSASSPCPEKQDRRARLDPKGQPDLQGHRASPGRQGQLGPRAGSDRPDPSDPRARPPHTRRDQVASLSRGQLRWATSSSVFPRHASNRPRLCRPRARRPPRPHQPANPVLPETGQDSSPALVAAAAVAVTGTIATFLARRRRRPAN